jgi:hypothetical protein
MWFESAPLPSQPFAVNPNQAKIHASPLIAGPPHAHYIIITHASYGDQHVGNPVDKYKI